MELFLIDGKLESFLRGVAYTHDRGLFETGRGVKEDIIKRLKSRFEFQSHDAYEILRSLRKLLDPVINKESIDEADKLLVQIKNANLHLPDQKANICLYCEEVQNWWKKTKEAGLNLKKQNRGKKDGGFYKNYLIAIAAIVGIVYTAKSFTPYELSTNRYESYLFTHVMSEYRNQADGPILIFIGNTDVHELPIGEGQLTKEFERGPIQTLTVVGFFDPITHKTTAKGNVFLKKLWRDVFIFNCLFLYFNSRCIL